MSYIYKATPTFWENFNELTESQQDNAKEKFKIFKNDPFDSRLRTHKIHKLSNVYKDTVYSVWIEGDLRAVFVIEGNTVKTLDIGSHDIYK